MTFEFNVDMINNQDTKYLGQGSFLSAVIVQIDWTTKQQTFYGHYFRSTCVSRHLQLQLGIALQDFVEAQFIALPACLCRRQLSHSVFSPDARGSPRNRVLDRVQIPSENVNF